MTDPAQPQRPQTGRVRYQGRTVCRAWYRKYVLKEPPRSYTPRSKILASIYLPRISATHDPAETRLVDINCKTDRKWVQDISDCYAMLPARELTTFFPPPNPPTGAQKHDPAISE